MTRVSRAAGLRMKPPDTHRAVVVSRTGGPEVLEVHQVETPDPVGDEVRVRVAAAGVAFGDVLLREGVRRSPRPPLVPGYDVAGVVDAIGPDAPTALLGHHVAGWTQGDGGYSEAVIIPSWAVAPHDPTLDPARVVAVVLNYVTAYQMLHRVARSRDGDRLLVHGAGGGVGTALLQLAAELDVDVFGTASRAKHDLVRRLGAIPIDYHTEDFVAVLRAAGGAHAVFDPIGGAHWRRSMRALGGAGVLVGYGFGAAMRDGRRNRRSTMHALLRQPVVTPLTLMQPVRTVAGYRIEQLAPQRPDWFNADLVTVLDRLADGRIDPIISATYRLEEAARAHAHLGNTPPEGKIVLLTGAAGR